MKKEFQYQHQLQEKTKLQTQSTRLLSLATSYHQEILDDITDVQSTLWDFKL